MREVEGEFLTDSSTNYTRLFLVGFLILGLLVILAVMSLAIATEKGTMLLRCEEPPVTVSIERNGKMLYDNLLVDKKQIRLNVYSGNFTVVAIGASAGQIDVINHSFPLSRGEEQLVRLERFASQEENQPTASAEP